MFQASGIPAAESDVIESVTSINCTQPDAEVIVGVGDDAAVLKWNLPAGWRKLVSTDTLIEGVHFDLRCTDLVSVGWKALAVNLSDIASMGGTPRFVLGNLGLSPSATKAQVKQLLQGVEQCAERNSVVLIGGDTFAAPQWIIGFTVLGETGRPPLLRSGARPGDLLWVSKQCGWSQIGLHHLWGRAGGQQSMLTRVAASRVSQCHNRPEPEILLGSRLHALGATACIDTSDSLAQSLLHLARASKVGLEIEFDEGILTDRLVIEFAAACRKLSNPDAVRASSFTVPGAYDPSDQPQHHASLAAFLLASSEDYALLFTTSPEAEAMITAEVAQATRVGVVVEAGRGCCYRDESGTLFKLTALGWQHR
jgi:thiamine-monophosphate kinase